MPFLWVIFLFSNNLSAEVPYPVIQKIKSQGQVIWTSESSSVLKLKPQQVLEIYGQSFGEGPDKDFSKILFGKIRALERNLEMYKGRVNLLQQRFYEAPEVWDRWNADIISWQNTKIQVRVPELATEGVISIQVQKRLEHLKSLKTGEAHTVLDPLMERIEPVPQNAERGFVDRVGETYWSNGIRFQVDNTKNVERVAMGEKIFWLYDYNIGRVHALKGMDWYQVLSKTGLDPWKEFGAIPLVKEEVPASVSQPYFYQPYPIPMPIDPVFGSPLLSGKVRPAGYVGFVWAESREPVFGSKGEAIGFSCVSCHGQRIRYESSTGKFTQKVFPGLPNPDWTMKWSTLSKMEGIVHSEIGPDGQTSRVDKTLLLRAMPPGTGEHSIIRPAKDGSQYGNDHLFSPITFPIITRHTPIRRALSHTEKIAGFEGSYIHSEEPDGAIGAMRSESLKQLTSYMATLDKDDKLLKDLGLYRWIQENLGSSFLGEVSEAEFLAQGSESFPQIYLKRESGFYTFQSYCMSCHQNNYGTWTDENMMPIEEVGSFFSPTIYHLKHQAIRTSMIRNAFWVEKRGLLHDGHVKSLKDLVHPQRCDEDSALYKKYYTIHENSFKVPKGTPEQELATRRHSYFVDAPFDSKHLYWDFQKMRREFGPRELGTSQAVPLPKTPHPWCVSWPEEVEDLVLFLLTL